MTENTAKVTTTVKTPKFLSRLPKKQVAITAALVVATALTAKYVSDRGIVDVNVTNA